MAVTGRDVQVVPCDPTEDNIQRALKGTGTEREEVPGEVLDVIGSGGMPLEYPVQDALEDRMDADFSDVRIHTGGKAAQAAEKIDARAFTCGNSIVFNSGEYDPTSPEGQHLLAHELAHVKQQNGGAPLSMKPKQNADLEIDPDPQLEREADQAAKDALSDGPVTINRMGTDVNIQRMPEAESLEQARQEAAERFGESVSTDPEALAEEVAQLKENQAKLFSKVNSERGSVDVLGEAAGAGVVGGAAGLAVGAATANPVAGALAGGAVADIGKTLYGKLWGKGRDAIANATVPEVSLDQLGGIKQSIEDLIDEKIRKRIGGRDTGEGDSTGDAQSRRQ